MIEKRSCKKEWFDSVDDDEDEEEMQTWYNLLKEYDEDCDGPYDMPRNVPWWHTIESYEKACKDFLLCLAALPVWYMNLLRYETRNGCCYCPFHKRFHAYFSKMNVKYFIDDLKIPDCSTKNYSGLMRSKKALTQHCQNNNGWNHKMILVFIHKLFDDEPDDYVDDFNALRPCPDGTETVKASTGSVFDEDTDGKSTVNSTDDANEFYVRG